MLATNTSTLDVDAIAAASRRPADVVGMHFFSPANVMRLVEVVHGRESSREALATAHAVAKRIGKIAIPVGNAFGFVGNRMLYAYGREKELMMLEGASPEAIDKALQDFGMAMGPNAVGDLAGLDIGFHVRKEWKDKPDDPRFYRISDRLAELGRIGQKSGRGFYRYDGPGGERTPDPEVAALIRAEADRLGDRAAQCRAERDRDPLHPRADQRGRADPGRGHRRKPGRHRRDLVQWLRLSASPGRPDVLRGHARARRACSSGCAGWRANTAGATGSPRACW